MMCEDCGRQTAVDECEECAAKLCADCMADHQINGCDGDE